MVEQHLIIVFCSTLLQLAYLHSDGLEAIVGCVHYLEDADMHLACPNVAVSCLASRVCILFSDICPALPCPALPCPALPCPHCESVVLTAQNAV